ncbi:MAG: hypothetical protein OIF32_05490 [Campylobacterales bacterium]|nr:hypothetical protein [Campylobacterales bacterium]
MIKELETNGGKYNCKIIPSKYMKSEVFTYTSVEELTDLNQKILGESSKNSKVQIDCKLYENDKEDPKKKSDSCKLFTGYLLYEFKMDNQPIYKIQIDYLNSKGKDISQRVDCIKDSLYQYK